MTRLEKLVGKTGKVNIIINDKLCYEKLDIRRASVVVEGMEYNYLRITANEINVYL